MAVRKTGFEPFELGQETGTGNPAPKRHTVAPKVYIHQFKTPTPVKNIRTSDFARSIWLFSAFATNTCTEPTDFRIRLPIPKSPGRGLFQFCSGRQKTQPLARDGACGQIRSRNVIKTAVASIRWVLWKHAKIQVSPGSLASRIRKVTKFADLRIRSLNAQLAQHLAV